jgi:hypothetical protein
MLCRGPDSGAAGNEANGLTVLARRTRKENSDDQAISIRIRQIGAIVLFD